LKEKKKEKTDDAVRAGTGRGNGSVLSGEQKKRLVKEKLREKKRKKKVPRMAYNEVKRKKNVPYTAQESIPYREMYKDGICRVTDRLYTKSIRFGDINYQLAQNDERASLFEAWCDFYNYFDPSISLQITCVCHYANPEELEAAIHIPEKDDEFNEIRREYAKMLHDQMAKGNNGLVRAKYVTFGIEADDIRAARPKLERIETDIRNNLRTMGVSCHSLSGYDRLKVLFTALNPGTREPFLFNYDMVARTGLSTKDFVAPTGFDFRESRYFRMGSTVGAVSYLHILASELSDKMLAEFMEMNNAITINLHVRSIDQGQAIRMLKSKITELDRSKIEEQKRAVRSGYDMDVLPSDLVLYGDDAKKFLDGLQNQNERMFLVTVLVMNVAPYKRKLDNIIFQTEAIAQKYNCPLRRLDFLQEAGLMSSLPIGQNLININRGMTTASTAVFVPFTAEELFQGGEALYYGLNAVSNNLIMADRKLLKNPNGIILGTPGSGKSFAAKREIVNAFLMTDDDIIIADPEAEYKPLVEALGGQVIRIASNSPHHINPLDINVNYYEDDDPVSLKAEFILSLCELILGPNGRITPKERTILDRCTGIIYRRYFEDPVPEKMPILEDLYNEILLQKEPEAEGLATSLEIYVKGSLKLFNHRTDVDVMNRVICFDIKDLGKQLKKLGMMVVQDAVWNRVTQNRGRHKNTRYMIDEFHLLLKDELTASFSAEIWKRFRKWGAMPTAVTQNVADLLRSPEIGNILNNSDFILMLDQRGADREILTEHLNISPHQLEYVSNSNEGEGLIFYGNMIIPFKDKFPRDTKLYQLLTTKPAEMA